MERQVSTQSDWLEEAQKWLGKETVFEGVDEVSRNDIRRKLEVYHFDCPLHYDEAVAKAHGYKTIIAPSTMASLWAMPAYWSPGDPTIYAPDLREKNGVARTEIPTPFTKGFNSASDVEYFEPLYPGDRLRGTTKVVEITPKQTRVGNGVFITSETRLEKLSGELVHVQRSTAYRYDPDPERLEAAEAAPRDQAPDGVQVQDEESSLTVDWDKRLSFESVNVGDDVPLYSLWLNYQRIVMSVAVDRMWSSIHHNRDAARSGGLDDIIFNTRGYEMVMEITLRRWIGLDGRLKKLGPVRLVKNSHPGDMLTCTAKVTDKEVVDGQGRVQLEISVKNPRAEAARGQATVSLPMGA